MRKDGTEEATIIMMNLVAKWYADGDFGTCVCVLVCVVCGVCMCVQCVYVWCVVCGVCVCVCVWINKYLGGSV